MLLGAIDIGGTKTLVGIVHTTGRILTKRQVSTDTTSLSSWLKVCSDMLRECTMEISCTMQDLLGIGINLPGMVDIKQGHLLRCSYPGWEKFPVKKRMVGLTGIDNIYVDNDVNSCAIGEMHFGFQNTYRNFLWITVSTGIGGAIVSDGCLIRGALGCAGEIGHTKVEYDKPALCACGQVGCLEAHASGTAITREVQRNALIDPAFHKHFIDMGEPLDAKGCAVLARNGDETALSIYQAAARALGRGIGNAVNLFNPEAVIFGGGVGNSLDIIKPKFLHVLNQTVNPALLPVEIVQSKLGYQAALIGAAALVVDYNGNRTLDC
ncbi:MAG TPA: ROK family protein [Lachnospiraceae bacterium]|nr:ROK family protein [Lachnospiraceae bacterium]HBI72027.1 ROK family protein [Lachnospiraceae bacterium]HBY72824.1 ROK family protein [Lachnospiraceae bacterium]HCA69397.1 ROK family protein [Lachnospiraceae bacterium]HCM13896.1 ROK family protein [Lachnospiraceae bacterium]